MRIMRRLAAICSVALILFPALAQADTQCQGTIAAVYIDNAGSVSISPSWHNGDITGLCSLTQTYNNTISAQLCYAWYAHVMQAYMNQKSVLVSFNLTSGGTCANYPTSWSAPIPNWIRLQ